MYELTVQAVFSAAHALVIKGVRETFHGHDWHLTVAIVGGRLDDDGLLVDFHAVQGVVDECLAPFRNANLNEVPPFDRVNPSAENVASHLALAIAARLGAAAAKAATPEPPRVEWVRVTEAPGCAVTYRL